MVGKEFNNEQMDGLFAGTSPFDAFRHIIYEGATASVSGPMAPRVPMINDVSRAFFDSPATRNICVEIPAEDMTDADRRHDKIGRLRMSVYGTRDVALNLQDEVAREMLTAGS